MKPLSPREQEAVDALKKYGSYRKAAVAMGITDGSVSILLKRARNKGFKDYVIPDRTIDWEPKNILAPKETVKVCAIGDYHDSPGQDKERMKWIARWIAEEKPDYVVQIGDFADWDSLSSHAKPGTVDHMERPTFWSDLESLEEVFSIYNKELGDSGPQKFCTLGNHEERAVRFDNSTPERRGLGCKEELDQLFLRYGWKIAEFGQWLFINGVGFIHIPMNLMGKEYRGRTVNPMANDAVFSFVFGDNHRKTYLDQPKIGKNQMVTLIGLGTAMPDNLTKTYARRSMTGWGYGVWSISIRAGTIPDHQYISMRTLEEKYG
jgi:hypothetical protein